MPLLRSIQSQAPSQFIASAIRRPTLFISAEDKVGRLEARTAFLPAEPDARQREAVAEPVAQQEAAVVVVVDAQQQAVAATQLGVRLLVSSVESAETAVVRFWIRATSFLMRALE
jgi:hypothetical protein